jgi:hypothetical protein
MAEDEVRKHAKALISAASDPSKGWKHRLREIAIEIGIIVFAVSVSIWFHNWAESRKDRQEEREFLIGLREDLKLDEKEMEGDRQSFEDLLVAVHYFEAVGAGAHLNMDSFFVYQSLFFSSTQIIPRNSRFEALKGSGKMNIIENKHLLVDITDLYQKLFPAVVRQNDYVNVTIRDNNLLPFLATHLQLDAKGMGTNWESLMHMGQMRINIKMAETAFNNVRRYTEAIDMAKEIIRQTDAELK